MKLRCVLLALLCGSPTLAQEPQADPTIAVTLAGDPGAAPPAIHESAASQCGGSGFLTGNRNFPNFIGYVSNPLGAIDPRAVTQIWPIFSSTWIAANPRLPHGDMQLYGAGLNLALSERLSIGMNQGGYAHADFRRNTLIGESGRDREGWLDLGGFVQYTVYQNVPEQCLATLGLRFTSPSGSRDIFQGTPPWRLAPYGTVGKEFGEFHVLATVGYSFPTESNDVGVEYFHGTVHLDHRCFGWLYPLVECTWAAHTTSVDLSDFRRGGGFIDFGSFELTGDIVMLAAGLNSVLIPNRLELGAVYTTSVHTERNFDFNGVLVKMVLRY